MINIGWIKLHRSLLEWEWYTDLNTRVLFLHLLITANYEDKKWRGILIKKGSRITGRKQLSDESGLTEQQVRTAIKKLELTKELTIKKDARGSMFTLVNWDKYQDTNQQINHENNQAATKDQPSSNQAATTTKEYNNIRNKENNNIDAEIKTRKDNFLELVKSYAIQIGDGNSQLWIEGVYRECKLEKNSLADIVQKFNVHLMMETNGDYDKSFEEYRRYCGNWIRQQMQMGKLDKYTSVKKVGAL